MTKELEPCPFCGKIPQANEVFRDMGVWKADICCWDCEFAIEYFAASRQDAERMAARKWNTRHKRKCKPAIKECHIKVGDEELSLWQAICDCGNIVGEDGTPNLSEFSEGCLDRFCSKCGAEVVDGD